jgi:hypothetical protein
MGLPTPEQIDGVVQAVTDVAEARVRLLGVTVDRGQIESVLEATIDALCMKQWRIAQAAGKAAADAITTEAQAEASQRGT